MKDQIDFEIDAEGNLSIRVKSIGQLSHQAVDKLLSDIADGMGGKRENKETLPLHTVANKQTLQQ